jgi:hypothetical protein
LTLAYKEVTENGTTVSKAARMFGVPDSTFLRDRTLGLQPVPDGDTFSSNPSPIFTKDEEKHLVDHD